MTVHPGAFCSLGEARGTTAAGTPMVCTSADPDNPKLRKRWRRDPAAKPAPRSARGARRRAATPPPELPMIDVPELRTVSGALSTQDPLPNTWGGDSTAVFFHPDGPIGNALRTMGYRGSDRTDFDGEPLADVLGKTATDVVMSLLTAQQGLDRYKQIRDRLPVGSEARALLDEAIADMDAPDSPVPDVPACTPAPLRELMNILHAIPLVRRDPNGETHALAAILREFADRRITGMRFAAAIDALGNQRHERFGDSGKMQIDRAIYAAVAALKADRSLLYLVQQ